ncbi:MAG: FecR family protein [Spirochaetia bacterium]|nr:FecR family protein [Spirochaetia bacterium]
MKKTIKISVIVAFLLTAVGCSEKQKEKEFTGVFTFVSGTVLHNSHPAKVGMNVTQHDIIETNEKSGAIIQFEDSALITLKSNTKLDVNMLAKGEEGKAMINIAQNSGSTFSKITPNKSKYSIKTPTAVAGVRGTSFSVEVSEDKKTDIKLLQGKVAVKKTAPDAAKKEAKETQDIFVEGAKDVVLLEAGQKIESTEKEISKKEELKSEEKIELETLNNIAFVTEEKLKDTSILKKEIENIAPSNVQENITGVEAEEKKEIIEDKKEVEKPKAKAEPKKITLDDLRKKYGQLSRIKTKSGKEYIGAFKQAGNEMKITTIDGIVSVPVSDIGKVSPY